MAWTHLILAGLLEIGFTTALRYVEGFTRPGPTLAFAVCAAASLYFLQRSLDGIPLGTAYAVWTGIGAAGTALLGIVVFGESAANSRLVFLVLLIGSIIGLKLVSH